VAQLVEHHLAKVRVAGSNPVVRSTSSRFKAPGLPEPSGFRDAHLTLLGDQLEVNSARRGRA
jgi:hypothetical protein